MKNRSDQYTFLQCFATIELGDIWHQHLVLLIFVGIPCTASYHVVNKLNANHVYNNCTCITGSSSPCVIVYCICQKIVGIRGVVNFNEYTYTCY